MARAASLPFVPALLRTTDGESVISEHDTVWDVTRWMPGAAVEAPDLLQVEAACVAIAQLHAMWRDESRYRTCQGVLNRLHVLREWLHKPIIPTDSSAFTPNMNSLLRQLMESVNEVARFAVEALEIWEQRSVHVQPCVRDLRGEHFLFTSGNVTGIVDYGAMAEDSPAVDLARFLGDVAGPSELLFSAGLRAYREAGGKLDTSDEFVRQLEVAGALGSAIIWINRLGRDAPTYLDTRAIENRLGQLLRRLQHFAPN
jgi:hypothetical protein